MEQTSIVSFFGGEVFEDEELGGEGEYGGYGTSSVPDGGGADGSVCTGWLAGPNNLLITNHHCLDSEAAVLSSDYWFMYETPADADLECDEANVLINSSFSVYLE